jgi:hypothetical protein
MPGAVRTVTAMRAPGINADAVVRRSVSHGPIPTLAASLASRAALVALMVCFGVAISARAQPGSVTFDIPAQPLASALEAYGEATGIEVFYDAALAVGRRSTAVKGSFSPTLGLKALLRGTGYIPRPTGLHAISVVPAPQDAAKQRIASTQSVDRYAPYFAVLQARLSQVLCNDDHAEVGSNDIIFKFWLTASGAISRADVIASAGDSARDGMIAKLIEGLNVGVPPPAGLPEPITMAVFPPLAEEAPGCPAGRGSNADH